MLPNYVVYMCTLGASRCTGWVRRGLVRQSPTSPTSVTKIQAERIVEPRSLSHELHMLPASEQADNQCFSSLRLTSRGTLLGITKALST